jgi:hypothetical protein
MHLFLGQQFRFQKHALHKQQSVKRNTSNERVAQIDLNIDDSNHHIWLIIVHKKSQ